jgi:hypothetical protein
MCRIILICGALIGLHGPLSVRGAEEPSRPTAALVSQYLEQLSSLRSISTKYRLSSHSAKGHKFSEVYAYDRMESTESVKKYRDGKEVSWQATDGTRAYSTARDPHDPDFIASVVITSSSRLPIGAPYSPLLWLGYRMYGVDGTVLEAYPGMGQLPRDLSERDGRSALHLKLGPSQSLEFTQDVALWLSADHGGLPMEWNIEYPPLADGQPNPRGVALGMIVLAVQEYRTIHDELLDQPRWFPWKMTAKQRLSEFTVEVLEARWNPPLDPQSLIPKGAPASRIVDKTAPGDPVIRYNSVAAAHARQKKQLERAIELAKASEQRGATNRPNPPASAPATQPISATQTMSGDRFRTIMFILAGVCAAILGAYWWRGRRGRT